MTDRPPEFFDLGSGADARRIAVRANKGASPGVVWLGGFKSDMRGTKAQALADWATKAGYGYVRFDYSGHGESGGKFTDGTIGKWLEEAVAVFDRFCAGPQVLVGSSMGGWITLLLARELKRRGAKNPKARLAGMVLIAPAVDFTEELMWKRFTPAIKKEIEETGAWTRASEYDPAGYQVTKQLIEEGRKHLLLGGMIETGCPVRILQGSLDPDVPWQHAVELVSRLAQDDVVLTMIKDGDHRLSRPEDLERLIKVVEELAV